MRRYTIAVTQVNEFEVEVYAPNEHDAINLARDLDSDEVMEYQTDARWEYQVVGEEEQ
jgi:hypothetical protein